MLTGTVASQNAGPAVVISFVIAGTGCYHLSIRSALRLSGCAPSLSLAGILTRSDRLAVRGVVLCGAGQHDPDLRLCLYLHVSPRGAHVLITLLPERNPFTPDPHFRLSTSAACMGFFPAWIIGWDLILEYLIGAATVAVGWSACKRRRSSRRLMLIPFLGLYFTADSWSAVSLCTSPCSGFQTWCR